MKTIKYLSASLLSLSLIACGGGGGSSETPVQPPAAPSNFTATAGNASANVSWTQVSGTTYTLYYATAANISPSNCSTTPSCVKIDNADPRTITGLTNGTPYYFVATASKDGQTSDPTATRMVTPVAPAVAAPTGFVATPGNGGVSLNWDVLPSTTYTVYYATSNTLTPANCATLTGCVTRANATPGQIASLTNGTPYYFIITATQSGTTSPASTPVSVTPVPAAVPAPTGVAATAGNAQATVSWNNVAGNTYNLYRATSASLTPANCATLAGCVKTTGVTTPSTVTGLTNGTAYYFVVTANNSGIESPASSVVNARPAAPLVVNAPTGVAATAGNAQATVSWTQLANTTYTMYLSESATVSPSNYNSQAGGRMIAGVTSPYTVPTLTNGKTYYFVLTATQQTTTSSPSTAVSAMPVAQPLNVVPKEIRYSASTEQLVMTSNGTNTLHIVSPFTGVDRTVALLAQPKRFQLSPDGKLAAVLYGTSVDLIDVEQAARIRSSQLLAARSDVLLLNSGGAYLLGGDQPPGFLNARTGEISTAPFEYAGTYSGYSQFGLVADKYTSEDFVVSVSLGISPSKLTYSSFYMSSPNQPSYSYDWPYNGEYSASIPLAFNWNQSMVIMQNGLLVTPFGLTVLGQINVSQSLRSASGYYSEWLIVQMDPTQPDGYSGNFNIVNAYTYEIESSPSFPSVAGEPSYGGAVFHSLQGGQRVAVLRTGDASQPEGVKMWVYVFNR